MSPVATLRSLRHGALKPLDPLWLRLGRLYRRALRLAPFKATVSHRIGPYGPFKLNAEFAFSDFARWGNRHNRGFAACVEACRGRTCVVDVGAHIGLVTLPVSGVLAPGGRVHAFEPAAANRRCLSDHLSANGIDNVTVVDALLGDEELEAVRFFEAEAPTGKNSVAGGGKRAGLAAMQRRQVTLDGYCRRHDLSPEVIKIDVEGGELAVLRGAQQTIQRCRPLIFLSVHPAHLAVLGHETVELTEVIDRLGYLCLEMDGTVPVKLRLREYRLEPKG